MVPEKGKWFIAQVEVSCGFALKELWNAYPCVHLYGDLSSDLISSHGGHNGQKKKATRDVIFLSFNVDCKTIPSAQN